jgi:predicted permease
MILHRIAIAIYALALRAFPPAHRATYAEEMIDAFRWELAVRIGNAGRWRGLRFALAAWLDAVRAGLGERRRYRRRGVMGIGMSWLDVKLGLRMLVKYKGLSLAGGLALAGAIGVGAAWYDVIGDQLHPRLPLPEGDRIVEIEMRNAATRQGEWKILHDFLNWRRDVRAIEELGAYRTLERNLILGDARPEEVTVAEITASAFRLTRVPPLLGRPLLDADEHPGAPPVAVLGYGIWQRRFGGRADAIGQTMQLGRSKTTIVGVMPEGFAFPVSHRLWVPLQLRPSGYAPLEGVAVQVFGRLAPGASREQAHAEVAAMTEREAASSPRTHQHLRPSVVAYGAVLVLPGERNSLGGWIGFATTHLPILLVLIVACTNVGTLVYARTATREAEIAVRHALGASRGRIVGQLFVEALVLALIATVVGLAAADVGLRWVYAFLSGQDQRLPFWIQPGLKFTTVIYAALLAVAAAALLGVLPALKATGTRVQGQLKNLGAGGSTLRFGGLWTTAMIAQVALTVICIPPAIAISEESLRDRVIRERFPSEQYLAASLELDRDTVAVRDNQEPASAYAARLEPLYRELERRVGQEPGVVAVTFGDRLPGMSPSVQSAEVETLPGAEPIRMRNLWTASVGPGYFEAFEKPIVSGRGLNDGDRIASPQRVVVNEAFARRWLKGANPVGRRVRYTSLDRPATEPWLEIVGMVRDIGMTPTNFGEAPYVFTAASPVSVNPLVMAVRTTGDPATLVPRVRAIAAGLDAGLRLDTAQPLEDLVWSEDAPILAISGGVIAVVALGLFLSAAGIFSLMSVSVARRTREIGLRAALGATRTRLLGGIFSRAIVLVGSGVAAGNAGLFGLGLAGVDRVASAEALITTSAVMLIVGLLACIEPARRALRIQPIEALKEA